MRALLLLLLSGPAWAVPQLPEVAFIQGQPTDVVVSGLNPGAPVGLVASPWDFGAPYCPRPMAPHCTDLLGPGRILAVATADAGGRATFRITAPPQLTELQLQAVEASQGRFLLSNVRTAPVLVGRADPDGDQLTNAEEVLVHGTNPFDDDTDGGGTPDGVEVRRGGAPLDPADD
jgi:hypothetical protein